MNASMIAAINHGINSLDLEALADKPNLVTTYKAIRPLLVRFSVFPVISSQGAAGGEAVPEAA